MIAPLRISSFCRFNMRWLMSFHSVKIRLWLQSMLTLKRLMIIIMFIDRASFFKSYSWLVLQLRICQLKSHAEIHRGSAQIPTFSQVCVGICAEPKGISACDLCWQILSWRYIRKFRRSSMNICVWRMLNTAD